MYLRKLRIGVVYHCNTLLLLHSEHFQALEVWRKDTKKMFNFEHGILATNEKIKKCFYFLSDVQKYAMAFILFQIKINIKFKFTHVFMQASFFFHVIAKD